MLSSYITTGRYDIVATFDMPDGEAMAKFVTAVCAIGNERTTTVRGYTPEEFAKLAAGAPVAAGA
jgi:uncharacterized protein with GYD domain